MRCARGGRATPTSICACHQLGRSAALAHEVFSGLVAEATSERTFSYSGRLFSKLRRRMSVVNLCAMVVGAAFPWQISDSEIMAEYESRLDRRRAAAAAAAAAASADAEDSD